ncbi:MAG: RDD family protein [Gammaproteobacteria bacterium]|nr:RDD family protein [Gammaproteobacteria bacterium]
MDSTPEREAPELPPAGLLRRLGAMTYDTLLTAALLILAMMLVVTVLGVVQGWDRIDTAGLREHPLYILYLCAVPFCFFVGFWKLAGETLGMRAWRLRIVDGNGKRPSWRGATVRFLGALLSLAPFGLGFLWILVDPEGLAWHDRLSGTRLVVTPRD